MEYLALDIDAWEYGSDIDSETEIKMESREDTAMQYDTTVGVKILDHYVKALLDTGADASLCSYQLWKQVSTLISKPQLRPAKNIILVDYSGTRKKHVKGEVMIPLRFMDEDVYHRFLVVDGLSRPVLLGRDFLNLHKADLDFCEGKVRMHLNDKDVTLLLQRQVTQTHTEVAEVNVEYGQPNLGREGNRKKDGNDVQATQGSSNLTSECECSYGDESQYCTRKGPCRCNADTIKNVIDEWMDRVDQYATDYDLVRNQPNMEHALKQITIAQVQDMKIIEQVYQEELQHIQCQACTSPDKAKHEMRTSQSIPRKNIEEEIATVVKGVAADGITKERLYQVLINNRRAFADHPGRCNMYTYTIEVNGDKPIVKKAYPIPGCYRQQVRDQIQQ